MWVLAILTSRSDVRATKDLRGGRNTPNMKEGWLCRTSYDEIVHTWWWPGEIQIELWFRSNYDDYDRSRLSDGPDLAVMIQIEWWSRSSDDDLAVMIQQWWYRSSDDPYPVMMIHIEWWSRSSDDDLDRVMIQMQMNMMRTWWWSRWYREEDLCW